MTVGEGVGRGSGGGLVVVVLLRGREEEGKKMIGKVGCLFSV